MRSHLKSDSSLPSFGNHFPAKRGVSSFVEPAITVLWGLDQAACLEPVHAECDVVGLNLLIKDDAHPSAIRLKL